VSASGIGGEWAINRLNRLVGEPSYLLADLIAARS
jgi:hypothetical protein